MDMMTAAAVVTTMITSINITITATKKRNAAAAMIMSMNTITMNIMSTMKSAVAATIMSMNITAMSITAMNIIMSTETAAAAVTIMTTSITMSPPVLIRILWWNTTMRPDIRKTVIVKFAIHMWNTAMSVENLWQNVPAKCRMKM